ncbi:L-histidine N(alpha)-methyltransferase [Epilithonimonas hominis]|uniref:Dimethylhistidine N-methyltransferase n=1 Tax=Epilithonimonas hominis TaxID=420404 RepID=A0A1H6LH53_9FLAO|nr:L-histidine N(alpha)-methyltransferase [Epilithonimonas hominis]SEH87855.1 dimethylhistidine N-methyltransferase [Epilithonimonas hominis]
MNLQLETDSQLEIDSLEIFQKDILEGLSMSPKKLSSKYFYDKNGDRLFQQIMAMPEYYLTDCELDIFKNKTERIASPISKINEPFDLIELGAGDAMKSSYLLKYLEDSGSDFTYMPIDISRNILSILNEKLSLEIPSLEINLLEGDYFDMLNKATSISKRKKVVMFLGGNIGNMDLEEARHFCREIRRRLNPGDLLLIGFDLKKNPHTILNAYNDAAGITAAFNLNLLTRINNELDADFNRDNFEHYQTYDPISGACRSFLVSLCKQKVTVKNSIFNFEENELIDMEISQKFSQDDIEKLAKDSGFHIITEIKDSKDWFVDSIWSI